MNNQPSSEFVTLFDRHYALRALALWRSLDRHLKDFRLWVVAMDAYTENMVKTLGLQGVEVIPVGELEDAELLEKKRERTPGEYCWTLTPRVFEAIFARAPEVPSAVYIDADVWLRQSPRIVLDAFEESIADVLVTEHAYFPAFDQSATSGTFCVQFLGAKRGSSSDIIGRWRDQCTDWCFAYTDGGRFGDQGYLNDWPLIYGDRVHIPSKKEWFQGPWNALRFPYSEAITYHFHGFKYFRGGRFRVGDYPVPEPHRRIVYEEYLKDLKWAETTLREVGLPIWGFGSTFEYVKGSSERIRSLWNLWSKL